MAFKDNIGMTEELHVEMVEEALSPLPPGGVYAVIDVPVTIRWITKDGKFLREDVVEFNGSY